MALVGLFLLNFKNLLGTIEIFTRNQINELAIIYQTFHK